MDTDFGYTTNNIYEFTSEDWARRLVECLGSRDRIKDGYLILHTSDAPETWDLISLICRNNDYHNRIDFVSAKVHEVCPLIKGVKVIKERRTLSMKYRSLITENIPTKNRGVIYETGYFEMIKQHLQPYIDAGTCFVSLDKGLSSESDAVRYQDVALKSGLYAGIVKSIEILNDIAIVDIEYFNQGYLNSHIIQENYEIEPAAIPDPDLYFVEFIVDVHDINKIKENNNHVTLDDLCDFYNVVKVRTW